MSKAQRLAELYKDRRLTEGYPGLDELQRQEIQRRGQRASPDCRQTVAYLTRLLPPGPRQRSALVVGCGPHPEIIRVLTAAGFVAAGVEPVPAIVQEARAFLGAEQQVLQGAAEALPVADNSQTAVLLESVLEHVDSPERTLAELYRVTQPGGLVYLTTTNRLAWRNNEYRRRFFQWFPPLLQEAYVHHHLHFDPSLANYTTRPAVHWFSYATLCRLGRGAGFYKFYSKLDVVTAADRPIANSRLRRFLFERIRTSPLLRALALTQEAGGAIFMCKRPAAAE